MRTQRTILAALALMTAAACSRGSSADDALKSDLALASSNQGYQPQQFVSPTEQGLNAYGATQPYGAAQNGYGAQAPVRERVVYRTAPRTTRSTSRSRTSGTIYREPTTVRHTKRDAAIGAGAGAVIGATTSRDRVKGAVIGAAAGGILGAIVGHTIDVQKQ